MIRTDKKEKCMLFVGFKVAKIAVKAIKSAKLTKSGFKAYLGAKKLRKTRLERQ